ncbi:hypothetical protein HDU86_004669 [Geranomyces michiganensis]|nr:hypothetical protein HDU86_004669 [Geranomyces michiganensis]
MQRTPPRAARPLRYEPIYPAVGFHGPTSAATLPTQEESPNSPLKPAPNAPTPRSWASEYQLQFTWKTPPRGPLIGVPTTHSDGVQVPEPPMAAPVTSHYGPFDPLPTGGVTAHPVPPPVLTYPNATNSSGGPAVASSAGPPPATAYLRPIPTPAGYIPSGFSHPECRAAGIPSRGDYGLVGARMDPHYMPTSRMWVPSNPNNPASERWQNGVWGRGNVYTAPAPADQVIEPNVMSDIPPGPSRSPERHVSFVDHVHPPLPAVTTNDTAEQGLGTNLPQPKYPIPNTAPAVTYQLPAVNLPAASNLQPTATVPSRETAVPNQNYTTIPSTTSPNLAPAYRYNPPSGVQYTEPASVTPDRSAWTPYNADDRYHTPATISPSTSTLPPQNTGWRGNLPVNTPAPATSAGGSVNPEYHNNLPATTGSAWAHATQYPATAPTVSNPGSPIHRYPMPAPPGGPPSPRNAAISHPDSSVTLKNYLVARARDSRMYQSEYRRAFCDWPAAAALAREREDTEAAKRASGNWGVGKRV